MFLRNWNLCYTLIETWQGDAGKLQPMEGPHRAMSDAARFGPNLTITRGQAIALQTTDNKFYAFATGGANGLATFAGFSIWSFITDANGLAYLGNVNTPSYRNTPHQTMGYYFSGIFNPADLQTAASPTANVLTFTPTTVTTGDVNRITYTRPNLTQKIISFTVGATATAAAVVTGLTAAWNADSEMLAIATPSGTTTFILTSNIPGNDINARMVSSVTGTGTLPKVNTTAAAGRSIADIQTSRPGCYVNPDGFWVIPGP